MHLAEDERERKRYDDKIKRETLWHENYHFETGHIFNSRLFYSPERTLYNYDFPKQQLLLAIREALATGGVDAASVRPSLLIAPLGVGQDVPYFRTLTDQISGVDVSAYAIASAKNSYPLVASYVCDIKNMRMFPDNHFDIVVMPLFFHHFVDFGFDTFVKEGYRVTKPGGYFFSLEPSAFHPISLFAVGARKLLGNITGIQPDERPIVPAMLTRAMSRNHFEDIKVHGAGFCHTRWPIWAARIINVVTRPILRLPLIKYLAFMCVFQGHKRGA